MRSCGLPVTGRSRRPPADDEPRRGPALMAVLWRPCRTRAASDDADTTDGTRTLRATSPCAEKLRPCGQMLSCFRIKSFSRIRSKRSPSATTTTHATCQTIQSHFFELLSVPRSSVLRRPFLRPTRHKIGHFGDILHSQSLGIVLTKLNLAQQQHICTNYNTN